MQFFHFVCGSGVREILTCMFDLEVIYWETGIVTGESFKSVGKHLNA